MRIRFRPGAHRLLRIAPGVQEDLQERAQRIAQAAGAGVAVLPIQEPHRRAHVLIGPVTQEANQRIGKDPAELLRAVDAGRGTTKGGKADAGPES